MNARVTKGVLSTLLHLPHCVLPLLVIWWEVKNGDGLFSLFLVQPHLDPGYRDLRSGAFSSFLSPIWYLRLCLVSVVSWWQE